MKRIVLLFVAVLVMSSSVPAFAMEKDECLLASMNCNNEVDSIQQKIQKLSREIQKGEKVYSAEELTKLMHKLKEVNALLENLEKGGH
jgi:lipid II:glycine glycyltransferase (peptidoglycan interpeptide bridge formation enzyme)